MRYSFCRPESFSVCMVLLICFVQSGCSQGSQPKNNTVQPEKNIVYLDEQTWIVSGPYGPEKCIKLGDYWYFSGEIDKTVGRELYRTDGTEEGTQLVKDVYPGEGDGLRPGQMGHGLECVLDRLYFVGMDQEHGYELWSSDGTSEGTIRLMDIIPGPKSPGIKNLTATDQYLFFGAQDTDGKDYLWRSDGTTSGTILLQA